MELDYYVKLRIEPRKEKRLFSQDGTERDKELNSSRIEIC